MPYTFPIHFLDYQQVKARLRIEFRSCRCQILSFVARDQDSQFSRRARRCGTIVDSFTEIGDGLGFNAVLF